MEKKLDKSSQPKRLSLRYLKDGDGDGNSQPHKGVKASANSDVMYFFTSAQDGDPSQDDVRLCLGDDLKKAQDHSQRQAAKSKDLNAELSTPSMDEVNKRESDLNMLLSLENQKRSSNLDSLFTVEEIKLAVWDCSGSKSPWPDGYNFNFIRRFWDLEMILSPTQKFNMEKGLCQGGPVSPFLFIIVVEEALNSGYKLYGVGVGLLEVDRMARIMSCSYGCMPFVYLGLPIGKSMRNASAWHHIVDQFYSWLSHWKAKVLSSGGRLTLIKSVISSLPLYYMSLFKALLSVLKLLESLRCCFLWENFDSAHHITWVSWSKSLAAKQRGVGRGDATQFWNDVWAPRHSNPLKFVLSRLFALESTQNYFGRDRWVMGRNEWEGNWCWTRDLRGRAHDDLSALIVTLSELALSSDRLDTWRYGLDNNGIFSVKGFRQGKDNSLKDKTLKANEQI
ncbi:hypothetical protein Tco_1391759 [Tanacetum coccineum]